MDINDITYSINGAVFEVNRVLGHGFLEKVYENALAIEGDAGYFYVSYYDSRMGSQNTVFVNAESTTNYNHVYQYDPLGWVSSYGYGNTTAWGANIFTTSSNENLVAVSFYTCRTLMGLKA